MKNIFYTVEKKAYVGKMHLYPWDIYKQNYEYELLFCVLSMHKWRMNCVNKLDLRFVDGDSTEKKKGTIFIKETVDAYTCTYTRIYNIER